MKHFGLIGNPLAHSRSPQLFADYCAQHNITNAAYSLYPLETTTIKHTALHQWVAQSGVLGFNVTVPYKRQIVAALDHLSPEARQIGAVNCVVVEHHKDQLLRLVGHNTDAPAFLATLQPLLKPWHHSALILGTGGAASAVAHALRQLNIDYLFVSRHPQQAPDPHLSLHYSQALQLATTHTLIINCTPLGMPPYETTTPWPDHTLFTSRHLVYDLIYNPSPTPLLLQAAQAGATVKDGSQMLRLQALLSYKLWKL